jgi:hypothetical protein
MISDEIIFDYLPQYINSSHVSFLYLPSILHRFVPVGEIVVRGESIVVLCTGRSIIVVDVDTSVVVIVVEVQFMVMF